MRVLAALLASVCARAGEEEEEEWFEACDGAVAEVEVEVELLVGAAAPRWTCNRNFAMSAPHACMCVCVCARVGG